MLRHWSWPYMLGSGCLKLSEPHVIFSSPIKCFKLNSRYVWSYTVTMFQLGPMYCNYVDDTPVGSLWKLEIIVVDTTTTAIAASIQVLFWAAALLLSDRRGLPAWHGCHSFTISVKPDQKWGKSACLYNLSGWINEKKTSTVVVIGKYEVLSPHSILCLYVWLLE